MVNYGIDARMIFDTSGKNLDGVNASLTDMQKLPISQSFTATDGQTLFTLSNSYTVGNKEVFVTVDGVPQFSGSGFSESSSTSITLSEGAQTGAKVIVTIYQTPSGVNSTLTDVQSSLAQIASQVNGTDTYSTVLTKDANGNVTKIELKDGSTVIQTTNITRDSSGNVTSVQDIVNGKTVTTTINRASDGTVSSTSKAVV